MIIRNRQMNAFSNTALENQMVKHMTVFSREHMESLGEEGLRRFVHFGIERCASYGWTQKGPVEFFLEAMVMLGSAFDTDPQYPWVREPLNDSADQMTSADQLHSRMMKYYNAVFGPGFDNQIEAIHRLLGAETQLTGHLNRVGESEMLRLLNWAYPEKSVFVGEASLRDLVGRGRDLAIQKGLREPADFPLITAMLFSFGHCCFDDPLYPWIAAAAAANEDRRSALLYRAFKIYLQQVVTNLERN
jgi:hypothetical protein